MTAPALEERFSSAQQALNALQQPNLDTTKTDSLSTLPKPTGSKVTIHKDWDQLEIIVPPKGFVIEIVPYIIFAGIWNLFLFVWLQAATGMGGFGIFLSLFALGHLYAGSKMIFDILYTLFGTKVLRINEETIELKHKLLGFSRHHPKPASREDILLVEYARGTHTIDGRRRGKVIGSQVNIWAGTKQFVVSSNNILSEIELEWISEEISEWLNVPMK